MTRALCSALVLGTLSVAVAYPQTANKPIAQEQKPSANRPNPQDLPPEEDENVAPKTYSFNPIQSEHELKVGNFYMRKGKYRAAAGRYVEATKWDPNSAEAFFHLGEAEEKLENLASARAAFQKVVQISPDSKEGKEAKRKLEKIGSKT
ncbi:MAG TPA: tetratricopeptide repeat protein [Bryobacteraceae bacterium]|nr:tetratricopeptide repeat protein [Bryobacteraceae bacterium]